MRALQIPRARDLLGARPAQLEDVEQAFTAVTEVRQSVANAAAVKPARRSRGVSAGRGTSSGFGLLFDRGSFDGLAGSAGRRRRPDVTGIHVREDSGWIATDRWRGWRPSGLGSDVRTLIVLHPGEAIRVVDVEYVPASVRARGESSQVTV